MPKKSCGGCSSFIKVCDKRHGYFYGICTVHDLRVTSGTPACSEHSNIPYNNKAKYRKGEVDSRCVKCSWKAWP